MDGYKLSRPISLKGTHLLYIADLKIFAASAAKLERVMSMVKQGMDCVGLNEKKCAAAHVRRGILDPDAGNVEIDNLKPISNLSEDTTYKFLGVLENSKQEDKSVLEAAPKAYLQRLSIIWSSPISDYFKVIAFNQYALALLTYLMWTQTWLLANLQQLDREARKIIVENGRNHPQGATTVLCTSWKSGEEGFVSWSLRIRTSRSRLPLSFTKIPTLHSQQ